MLLELVLSPGGMAGGGGMLRILARGGVFQSRSAGLGSVVAAGVLTQQYQLPSLPHSLTSFLSHLPKRLPALEFFSESVSGGAQTKPSLYLPLWGFHKYLLVEHRPGPACAWASVIRPRWSDTPESAPSLGLGFCVPPAHSFLPSPSPGVCQDVLLDSVRKSPLLGSLP